MEMMRKYPLLIVLLFFCSGLSAQQAAKHSIEAFVNNWRGTILRERFECPAITEFYGDTVNWYGKKYPHDSVCAMFGRNSNPGILARSEYTITALSGKTFATWQVDFAEENSVITAGKLHYLLIESPAPGQFRIIAQSSFADDAWASRKKEIANDTIVHKKKRYYVLRRDSAAFGDGKNLVYFLTDSLQFYEPVWMPVCVSNELSYTATGSIFVAIGDRRTGKITAMRTITDELSQQNLESAELVFGGFPCFSLQDSVDADRKYLYSYWAVPRFAWTHVTNDQCSVKLTAIYNYGDACWFAETTLLLDRKKKVIKADRFIRKPDPKRIPH